MHTNESGWTPGPDLLLSALSVYFENKKVLLKIF